MTSAVQKESTARTFLTVRELIAELQKLPEDLQNAPVAKSVYDLGSHSWVVTGVDELVPSPAKVVKERYLVEVDNPVEGKLVKVVILY
jgi:hypothetical protein